MSVILFTGVYNVTSCLAAWSHVPSRGSMGLCPWSHVPSRGVSVQGVSVQRGIWLGRSLSRRGSLSRQVSVQRGGWWSLSREVPVWRPLESEKQVVCILLEWVFFVLMVWLVVLPFLILQVKWYVFLHGHGVSGYIHLASVA